MFLQCWIKPVCRSVDPRKAVLCRSLRGSISARKTREISEVISALTMLSLFGLTLAQFYRTSSNGVYNYTKLNGPVNHKNVEGSTESGEDLLRKEKDHECVFFSVNLHRREKRGEAVQKRREEQEHSETTFNNKRWSHTSLLNESEISLKEDLRNWRNCNGCLTHLETLVGISITQKQKETSSSVSAELSTNMSHEYIHV